MFVQDTRSLFVRKADYLHSVQFNIRFSQTVIRVYGDVQFAFLKRNIFEWDQFNLKNHAYKKFFLTQKCNQLKEKKI